MTANRLVLIGGYSGRTNLARSINQSQFVQLACHLRVLVYDGTRKFNQLKADNLCISTMTRWCVNWGWYRWPGERLVLPLIVPDVPAGVPCPEVVGAWQIAAILLERVFLAKGWVTRADARKVMDDVGGKWNPSTMLNRYFVHRGDHQWVIRHRPSAAHPGAVRSMDKNPGLIADLTGATNGTK